MQGRWLTRAHNRIMWARFPFSTFLQWFYSWPLVVRLLLLLLLLLLLRQGGNTGQPAGRPAVAHNAYNACNCSRAALKTSALPSLTGSPFRGEAFRFLARAHERRPTRDQMGRQRHHELAGRLVVGRQRGPASLRTNGRPSGRWSQSGGALWPPIYGFGSTQTHIDRLQRSIWSARPSYYITHANPSQKGAGQRGPAVARTRAQIKLFSLSLLPSRTPVGFARFLFLATPAFQQAATHHSARLTTGHRLFKESFRPVGRRARKRAPERWAGRARRASSQWTRWARLVASAAGRRRSCPQAAGQRLVDQRRIASGASAAPGRSPIKRFAA